HGDDVDDEEGHADEAAGGAPDRSDAPWQHPRHDVPADGDNDPCDPQRQTVLRVPLDIGVVLLRQHRDEGEDAEVRQEQHETAVRPWSAAAGSGWRRWGRWWWCVRPASRWWWRVGGRRHFAHWFSLKCA